MHIIFDVFFWCEILWYEFVERSGGEVFMANGWGEMRTVRAGA